MFSADRGDFRLQFVGCVEISLSENARSNSGDRQKTEDRKRPRVAPWGRWCSRSGRSLESLMLMMKSALGYIKHVANYNCSPNGFEL